MFYPKDLVLQALTEEGFSEEYIERVARIPGNMVLIIDNEIHLEDEINIEDLEV